MFKIINQIIHPATSATTANMSGFTYDKVYAGTAASPTINGTVVSMAAGSTIEILVHSISVTADIYLIGIKKINNPPQVIGG